MWLYIREGYSFDWRPHAIIHCLVPYSCGADGNCSWYLSHSCGAAEVWGWRWNASLVSTLDTYGNEDLFTRAVSNGGYGFGPRAFYYEARIKFTLPRPNFTFTADVAYAPLEGSGRYDWVESTSSTASGVAASRVTASGITASGVAASGSATSGIEYKADLYMVAIGGHWNSGRGSIRPYFGGRLLWSTIPEVRATAFGSGVDHIPMGKMSFSRVGFGLVGGTEIDLVSRFDLDLVVRYNFTSPLHNRDDAIYRSYFNSLAAGVSLLYEISQ